MSVASEVNIHALDVALLVIKRIRLTALGGSSTFAVMAMQQYPALLAFPIKGQHYDAGIAPVGHVLAELFLFAELRSYVEVVVQSISSLMISHHTGQYLMFVCQILHEAPVVGVLLSYDISSVCAKPLMDSRTVVAAVCLFDGLQEVATEDNVAVVVVEYMVQLPLEERVVAPSRASVPIAAIVDALDHASRLNRYDFS